MVHCCWRRTEPQVTYTENFVKFGYMVSYTCNRTEYRPTDRQACWSQYLTKPHILNTCYIKRTNYISHMYTHYHCYLNNLLKAWFSLANVFVFMSDLFEVFPVWVTPNENHCVYKMAADSWSKSKSYSTSGLVSAQMGKCHAGIPSRRRKKHPGLLSVSLYPLWAGGMST